MKKLYNYRTDFQIPFKIPIISNLTFPTPSEMTRILEPYRLSHRNLLINHRNPLPLQQITQHPPKILLIPQTNTINYKLSYTQHELHYKPNTAL